MNSLAALINVLRLSRSLRRRKFLSEEEEEVDDEASGLAKTAGSGDDWAVGVDGGLPVEDGTTAGEGATDEGPGAEPVNNVAAVAVNALEGVAAEPLEPPEDGVKAPPPEDGVKAPPPDNGVDAPPPPEEELAELEVAAELRER